MNEDYKLENIKYYDIESYWTHFFMVVKDYNNVIEEVFMIADNEVRPTHYKGIKINYSQKDLVDWIRNNVICAFNGFKYDDMMLFFIMNRARPTARQIKLYSNRLINAKDKSMFESPWDKIRSIDASQEINTDRIHGISLKHVAANMGLSIIETGVGFDNPITNMKDLLNELEYCDNDVYVLIEIMKTRQRINYIEQKMGLVKMVTDKYEKPQYFNVPGAKFRRNFINLMKVTNGTLVSYLWAGIPETPIDWDFELPEAVVDIWKEDWAKPKNRRSITINRFGNTIKFGYGGLHGIHDRIKEEKNLYHIDVASMYPSLIILWRILGIYTEMYAQMKYDRVLNKNSDDILKQAIANIQKLILNMSYGKLLEPNSKCSNVSGGIHVCFRGQEAIYNIGLMLEDYGTIYQFNTDGIYFKPHNDVPDELWRTKIKMWEEDFGLDMDIDPVDSLVQRDVNNYIAIEHGKIVSKGAIGKTTFEDDWSFVNPCHKSMDNIIVNKAVQEYLLHGTPVYETICNKDEDIRSYMTTFKVTNAFNGLSEGYGGKEVDQKVNRIINVKSGYDYYKIKDIEESIASFKKPKTKEYKVGDKVILDGGKIKRLYEFDRLEDDMIIYFDGKEEGAIKYSSKYCEISNLKYGVGDEIKEGRIERIFEQDDMDYFEVLNDKGLFNVKCKKMHYNLEFNYEKGDIIEIEESFKDSFEIVDVTEDKVFYKKPKRKGYQRISNVTSNCLLINDDIRGKTAGDYDINYSFYLSLANKELRRWR